MPQVSIHAPAWGATNLGQHLACWFERFQSTRPRGARLEDDKELHGYIQFQSTRPRGARHSLKLRPCLIREVSIHAPAWGATFFRFDMDIHKYVSIHAPAWGATSIIKRHGKSLRKFQSTRPRGARREEIERLLEGGRFQSTRPRGARRKPRSNAIGDRTFQSTRPRGARL
mgnify:CR=1 FL=1